MSATQNNNVGKRAGPSSTGRPEVQSSAEATTNKQPCTTGAAVLARGSLDIAESYLSLESTGRFPSQFQFSTARPVPPYVTRAHRRPGAIGNSRRRSDRARRGSRLLLDPNRTPRKDVVESGKGGRNHRRQILNLIGASNEQGTAILRSASLGSYSMPWSAVTITSKFPSASDSSSPFFLPDQPISCTVRQSCPPSRPFSLRGKHSSISSLILSG